LQLHAVNLGGWLLWEGWVFGKGLTSESAIVRKLTEATDRNQTEKFRDGIRANFIADADLAKAAAIGFNCVRVPFHWQLLEKDDGWKLLDQLISACEKHRLRVVLDLHAAPGGQNGMFISDAGPGEESVWQSEPNRKRTVELWKKIAHRYSNRKIIAGYDVLNEPIAPDGDALIALYRRIIEAIRAEDANHLIILEGNKLATDLSIFKEPLTENQAWSFHLYNWIGDDRVKRLESYRDLSAKQNVPMWCGEFGENNHAMIASTARMIEDPKYGFSGWAYWTWKKAPNQFPGLVTITLPADWKPVLEWTNGWFAKKPERADAIKGMEAFLQSVRLENCKIDAPMTDALFPARK